MGKKKSSRSSPTKLKKSNLTKHEKQPQVNNLMEILRPKVYITDTFNFKSLVQQLTGNGKYAAAPPLSPPAWQVDAPLHDEMNYYQENNNNNLVYQESISGAGAASIEAASPELGVAAASLNHREMEIFKGLEAMLMMEMDSDSCDYDVACDNYEDNEMFKQQLMQDHQHQVCVYDYDLANFV